MKRKVLNLFYVLTCFAMIGIVTSCSKNDEIPSKTETGGDTDKKKPEEKPAFDAAYAFGELPYLKHGDVKGAAEFEKKLGKRVKGDYGKLGEVFWGDQATFFKGARYTDKEIMGLLTIPVVKIGNEFNKIMADATFADYGVSVITDGNGNVSPCHIYWSSKLKIKVLIYDATHKALKSIRAVAEFRLDANEPEQNQGEEPEKTVIITSVTDFPSTDVLSETFETLPTEKLTEIENTYGYRSYDADGSDEGMVYFRTKDELQQYTNLNAVMYFYDDYDKAITAITLSCPVVKTPEDLERAELKQWFATNGYTFVAKKDTTGKTGAIYENKATGVQAYIYVKSSGVCFINLTKK